MTFAIALSRGVAAACAAFVFGCLLLSTHVNAQSSGTRPTPDTVPLDVRERVAATLDEAARRVFAHWSAVPTLRYDTLVASYRVQARALTDRRAFDLATLAFLAALKNGHTDFNDEWLWRTEGAPLRFTMRYIDSAWVVARSALPELQVGERLLTIDGEPFETFFQRQKRYIGASSDRAARTVLPARTYLFPMTFVLGLTSDRTVTVHRGVPFAATAARRDSTAPSASAGSPMLSPSRWLVPEQVGYIRIPSFNGKSFETSALRALERFGRATALVLDVRENGGGSTPWKLQKALAGARHRDFKTQADHAAPGLFVRLAAPLVRRLWPVPHYDGRVVVLTNGSCASACEDLVVALKGRRNVTIVGDTTFGSTGQPRMLDFGNRMTARIGARRAVFEDGTQFEGVGIAPGIVMRAGIGETTDTQLARALAIAVESGAPRAS